MPDHVVSRGIYPSATLHSARTEETTGKRVPSKLELEVDVSDALVMEAARGADVFERVSVGIPYTKGGKLQWKEVPLAYEGQEIRGYYARELVDSHEAVVSGVNKRMLEKHGFYVKLEYGSGDTVVWGQEFGNNHKPVVR